MSNLQSKLRGVKFEPVRDYALLAPGGGILIFGVIYPGAVIALELVSRMCAETFFDPMPTYWHALAAGFVPASNLLVWKFLQDSVLRNTKWLVFANGAAIAIAGFYSLLFLPLLPIALVLVIIGVGLFPFAPLSSFVCALHCVGRSTSEMSADRTTTGRSSVERQPALHCCWRSTSRPQQPGSACSGSRAACRRSASED